MTAINANISLVHGILSHDITSYGLMSKSPMTPGCCTSIRDKSTSERVSGLRTIYKVVQ